MSSNRNETAVNTVLAEVLTGMSPAWRDGRGDVIAEERETSEERDRQPDVRVQQHGLAPVLLECKYDTGKANRDKVEEQSASHLGVTDHASGRPVEAVVAVLYPEAWKDTARVPSHSLADRLCSGGNLRWALFTPAEKGAEDGSSCGRLPDVGWLSGDVSDLADMVEMALVSQSVISHAADRMQQAVEQGANMMEGFGSAAGQDIADLLKQQPEKQTLKMAAALLVNAFVFQSVVAGEHSEVRDVETLLSDTGGLTKMAVLGEWDAVLKINYWPIFAVAREILKVLPAGKVQGEDGLLERLAGTATDLVGAGLTNVQSLAGQIFGKLISDRKFLATFYTRPESAALLAELGVGRLAADWSDSESAVASVTSSHLQGEVLRPLCVVDPACGTGTLLSAAYRRLAARLRRAGVDDTDLHQTMMQEVLVGLDIMPAATHLTATMLSSVHPGVTYKNSRVALMPYGNVKDAQGGERLHLGSLDFLTGQKDAQTLFGTSGQFVSASEGMVKLEDKGVEWQEEGSDLVIMNPPFTSPTNHERAKDSSDPVPSFAGFGTTPEEQKDMSDRLKSLQSEQKASQQKVGAGNGYAGLGANFFDLAHRKVAWGGGSGDSAAVQCCDRLFLAGAAGCVGRLLRGHRVPRHSSGQVGGQAVLCGHWDGRDDHCRHSAQRGRAEHGFA